MRKELKKLEGQRDFFSGTFAREGVKSSFKGAPLPTILLKEVRRISDNKLMCDHLWLNKTKALAALDLFVGLEIRFAARVKPYSKGYRGRKEDVKREFEQDFKLSHPTQVEAVKSLQRGNEEAKSQLIIRKRK